MQLREFAESVLFSTSLDEKLSPPREAIVDDAPGAPLRSAPDEPGRPAKLRMARQRGRRESPPVGRPPESDAERARLLHFFANHELLATELMALALLRFPAAPPAFRAGLLRTLREEQVHTRLYLRRIEQCGMRFGDLPVNGFFWSCVGSMASPIDYVARLSLTFEQANLDYSRHFAQLFAEAGDLATARILDRIYRDEIGHVGYGLMWFRRWKPDAARSDWDAYAGQLDLPLSPARAKAGVAVFNEEGRREAGIDEEFIRRLKVFSQSRGRTPHVWHFNPAAEVFAANPDAALSASEHAITGDLETLPLAMASADDVVLVHQPPRTEFLHALAEAGIPLPEFATEHDLSGRKVNELKPWAWSPDAVRMFRRLELSAAMPIPAPDPDMFAKTASRELLRNVLEAGRPRFGDDWLVDDGAAGRIIQDISELPEIRPLVVKHPFSASGRARRILRERELSSGDRRWIERQFEAGARLIAEPWADRVFDFAVQYERRPGMAIRRVALTHVVNRLDGRFRMAVCPARFGDIAGEAARRFLHGDGARRLRTFLDEVLDPAVDAFLGSFGHVGAAGVDAFVCRGTAGELRLRPVVEVNPRWTMGRVAAELSRWTEQNTDAAVEIVTAREAAGAGAASLHDWSCRLPPLQRNKSGRITAGAILLNDPAGAKGFLAVFRAGQHLHPLIS